MTDTRDLIQARKDEALRICAYGQTGAEVLLDTYQRLIDEGFTPPEPVPADVMAAREVVVDEYGTNRDSAEAMAQVLRGEKDRFMLVRCALAGIRAERARYSNAIADFIPEGSISVGSDYLRDFIQAQKQHGKTQP